MSNVAAILPTDSHAVASKPAVSRARVTNGSAILTGVDGRSAKARRYRDVMAAMIADLGGDDALGEGERALVRQAAALTVASEEMSAAIVRGEAVDDNQLTRVANALARIVGALSRRARARKPATATLTDYLATGKAG